MKKALLIPLLLATLSGAAPAAEARPARGAVAQGSPKALSPEEKKELAEFVVRFSEQKNAGLMSSVMWTLTHGSYDDRAVKEILEYFRDFFTAVEKDDQAALAGLGGARGFKDKFVGYLGHSDDTVQASAALILTMTGDAKLAPHIAKLLRDPRPPRKGDEDDYPRARYAGGRAAVALGLLGAAEYKPDLVRLLGGANEHDRAGAAQGLALLKATDAAPHVARLLGDRDDKVRAAATEALVELGVGGSYLKEIALNLSAIDSELRTAAMFALVKLKAKGYAKEIAALLKERFSKSEAAIALALLGANEYEDEIAKVLEDEEPLNRCAAMLALGILRAERYAGAIHRRMSADKSYVENYGAVALVLLESREFARPALAVLLEDLPGKSADKTPDITGLLHSVPATMREELRALQDRLVKSFELLKAEAANGARESGAKP
jgi:HEAT repeat protein